MQASNAPAKIPLPFANSGTKNTIPTASQIAITPGAASLTDGFPPVTRTPIAAGGVPPFGADMNGILFEISANTQWENAGGFYPYDATFSTAIGGYPKGAVLAKVGNNGLWMSTVDNNTTNPDTGGAGWIDPFAGRLLGVQTFTSSSTYTPGTYNGVTATKARVRAIGGGGAGGGCAATTSTTASAASGGNAGAYGELFIQSGLATQTVTIGGGAVGSPGAGVGPGGTTSFGSLLVCPGGNSGFASGAGGVPFGIYPNPTLGTVSGSGNLVIAGTTNLGGASSAFSLIAVQGGKGADSIFGGGGAGAGGGAGTAAASKGAGGGGAGVGASGGSFAGGTGGLGYLIVEEYA
jgi:hypothetical protein